MVRLAHSLEKVVQRAVHLKQVRKADLHSGDLVPIATRNSVCSVYVLDKGLYLVSGGWFDGKELSPVKTTIIERTLGGSIVKLDIVAACGLRLEFGGRVVTIPIQKVCVIPLGSPN